MANTDLGQAYKLLMVGDKQRAGQIITQILRDEPHNAEGWYLASFVTEDPLKRIQALERAVALDPQHTRAWTALNADPMDETLLFSQVFVDTQAQQLPARKKKTELPVSSDLVLVLLVLIVLVVYLLVAL